MKRCPACKRVEPDDALTFCRADGTALVNDPGSSNAEASTKKFGSALSATEVETSVLPQHATDAGVNRPTAPTTVLDRQPTIAATNELSKAKRRRVWAFSAGAIVVIAIAVSAYFYLSRDKNTASKNSIAVLPGYTPYGLTGELCLFDGATGERLWHYQTPAMAWPCFISADGSGIFAGSDYGVAYYFTPESRE